MTPEQRKLLEHAASLWNDPNAPIAYAIRAAIAEIDSLRSEVAGFRAHWERASVEFSQQRTDRERLDKLQEMQADTIYFDDGQVVDIGGKYFGDVRKAIDGIEVKP